MTTAQRYTALVVVLALAVLTQCTDLLSVPGLHFDEAWQGLYAQRIAAEPGFWPLTAMNSYTSPVVHYLMAAVFKVWGPSLASMRGFYAVLNLLTLVLLMALLMARQGWGPALWFGALWAVLPMSVHLHRFNVEMTGFFGICLAAALWGLHLWPRRPLLGALLVVTASVAGAYSHVLFVAVMLGLAAAAFRHPSAWEARGARGLAALIAALWMPLALRMALDLRKASAGALVVGFAVLGAAAYFQSRRLSALFHRTYRWVLLFGMPFLPAFVFLFWEGPFSYGQATGELPAFWLPVNTALFIFIARRIHRRHHRTLTAGGHDGFFLWKAFMFAFLASSLMILKQSPRYYTGPMMLMMGAAALELSAYRGRIVKSALAMVFVAWNLYAFVGRYLVPFKTHGATERQFSVLFYRDSARDFRPFQEVFGWLESQGCGTTIRGVEDDRFLRPIEFLQLSTPAREDCPWPRERLIFRTIPANQADYPSNLELMASRPEWGDLGVWLLKQE